jgi:MoCo/4Fe-4S cofactor protein with predicted Tat translocation signal
MSTARRGKRHLDLEAVRARLAGGNGRDYWRSLEKLAETEEFNALLRRELPRQMAAFGHAVTRRELLKLAGIALALTVLPGCTRRPAEEILPYARPPEDLAGDRPLFYATAMALNGSALGLLVESHEGRPTKVEGNPRHPASLGGTDAFAQALVYTLYDPDRSRAVLNRGRVSSWAAFLADLRGRMAAQRARKGAGLRILTETVTSPTLADQLHGLLAEFSGARWHRFDPLAPDNLRAGARMAFGGYVDTQYRFDRADVVLSLDADFLSWPPGHVRYARDFTLKRRVRAGVRTMNRLYVVEPAPTITGAMADHRLPLRPTHIERFARAVARALGIQAASGEVPELSPEDTPVFSALVEDLQAHRGSGLIVAGRQQPPIVHALAHAMNQALGNAGVTVIYTDPVEADPVEHLGSLQALVEDMAAGRVEELIIVGGNPVYTAPADLQFAEHLARVPSRVHQSLYEDETSALCSWHVPAAHELEAWSDARAYDGTVSIIQPLIAPLYGGKTAHELVAALLGHPRSSYEIVREFWKSQHRTADFEQYWRGALHEGVIAGTALPPKSVSLRADFAVSESHGRQASVRPGEEGLEVVFSPDPTIWDGCFANNAWLQELPKPLTKLTWDNAALLGPQTAERLDLHNEEVVELHYHGRTLRAPVLILPGHAAGAVTLPLGYGRTHGGRIATGQGFNAYTLRRSDALWFDSGLEIRKTGERHRLALTHDHHRMEGRDLIQVSTFKHFRERLHIVHGSVTEEQRLPSLYPGFSYKEGYAWGMAVDLNACIGCNACVVACQAENNVPTVGKTQVMIGREMHWLRVDRYYVGDLDRPNTYFEPALCMHCENAPCELVCPVGATNHSDEGLNQMIYNRCVGTRYCSNNCPYKVRRFNFLQFADVTTPSLQLMYNPDVTVRARGVMEKCTYCVQRIQGGKIRAEEENRRVHDGEIKTACQQACPAEAIIFGDLNDPNSRVAQLRAQPHSYALLAELNTQPRTTYLARIRNPNPKIEPE